MPRIINCLIVDDEPVAREILQGHLSKIDTINIVSSCKNAVEAFKAINSHHVDLVFLDINMPEISGLSFAKAMNQSIKVIFTTAYREYAVDGFDLQAVDYLLKPISFERLLQAINKFMGEVSPIEGAEKYAGIEKNDSVFVRSDRKMIKINFSEISYIESLSDYIKIYVKDKTIVTRETISSIEARLPKKDFIRVHRSFIVSFDGIESFTRETIEISGKEIPISRSYRSEVLSVLENN